MTQYCSLDYRSCDIRATGIDDRKIRGVAVQYERWQRVADKGTRAVAGSSRLREKIASGAVRIEDIPHLKALVNHKETDYLGSTRSGALKLTNTANTLDFELQVPRTRLGDDILGMMAAELVLPVSIGFLSKGPNSNIKVIDFKDDEKLEESISSETEGKVIEEDTALDNTDIDTQVGELNGSDYVEGRNVKTGRWWRVYKSLDIREISLLFGLDPAWRGVFAQQGSGQPETPPDEQAFRYRERELQMVRLRC